MKFYNRESELKQLRLLYRQASKAGTMVVLTGRRRVGKTLLALEYAKSHKYIYMFVSKKSERLLCSEFIQEIKKTFSIPVIGEIKRFKEVFELVLQIAETHRFTLIIDEFQEFYNINTSIYSEIQHLWDLNKHTCKLNLIVIGSVYSLMLKIFQNAKEPLFGRADRNLYIKPFEIRVCKNILINNKIYNPNLLFYFYLITGGMPKYLDILITNNIRNVAECINFIFSDHSPFLFEGKHLLIEEFGKEYGTYFSILELISIGKTARTEIESILERNIGGYLDRLENDYSIISKYKPITAKPLSRLQKYMIEDNFLNFWFRFIYRNRSAIETGNFKYIKEIIKRDLPTYSGKLLERFFQTIFAEQKKFNKIGSYWEKGNTNEIDLVAVNDLQKKVVIGEVKLNKLRIDKYSLQQKSRLLIDSYKGYKIEWEALSIEDIDRFLK